MIKEYLNNYKIILLSSSYRRKQLLKKIGLDFEVVAHNYDESYPNDLEGKQIINYICSMKVESFGNLNKDYLLIGADTAIYSDGKLFGKPKSREDAYHILRFLSGKKHDVVTAVCIKTKDMTIKFDETTSVFFDDLEDEEIYHYIDNHNPYDKSGSYGIQDWIGCIGINRIEGCFFNVMGLPLNRFYREIKKIVK